MLREDMQVVVFDSVPALRDHAAAQGFTPVSLPSALSSDVIFYCVPISAFETALAEHAPHFAQLDGPRTLVDVLSVKLHAREVFERHLPAAYHAMLTHPMFGPDSVAVGGLKG